MTTPRKTPPSSPKRPARAAKPKTPPAEKPKTSAKRPARTPRKPAAPRELTNVERLKADLEEMGTIPAGAVLAGTALTLARDLDNRKNSATSHAMCAKALIDVMAQLRELAPTKTRNDGIDKLRAKHDRRRSRLRAVE